MQQLTPIELSDYPILLQDKNLGKESHYLHVKTIEPANVLMESGWKPREVILTKPRKELNMGFQKHRVRFFHPDIPQINGSNVELLLTNSYDSRSSFQIEMGVFRLVCANGLVVGDTYAKERVRHVGYSDQKVFDAVNAVIGQSTHVLDTIDDLSSTTLSNSDIQNFGFAALKFRLKQENDIEDENSDGNKWVIDSNGVNSLLYENRTEDKKTDIWTVFNTIQENICRRGFYALKTSRGNSDLASMRKVRAIKNQFGSDNINKSLWTMAENVYSQKRNIGSVSQMLLN